MLIECDDDINSEELLFEVMKRKYTCVAFLIDDIELHKKIYNLESLNNGIEQDIYSKLNKKIESLYNIFNIFQLDEKNKTILRNILESAMMLSSILLTDELKIDFKKEFKILHDKLNNEDLRKILKNQIKLY